MRQYSADAVENTWLGLDFKEGLAAGSFITEARNAPTWTQKPAGAVPKVTRVYNPDRSGTVTITVDQESQLHQSLKGIANAERDPGTRDKVGDMVLKDTSSGEEVTWVNAYITTKPDLVRGNESQTFAWVFAFEDFRDAEIDPLANQVGN
jgi:hypothetical protein